MTGQKKTLVACYVEKKYNQGIRTDTDEKQSNNQRTDNQNSQRKEETMKKKIMIVLALVLSACMLTACGSSTCKKCDNEVYKDGLCQEHYYEAHPLEALNDLADGLKDLFG